MYITGVWFALRNTKDITEKLFVTPNTDHPEECGTCPHLNPVTPAQRMHGGCSLLAMVTIGASWSCAVALG